MQWALDIVARFGGFWILKWPPPLSLNCRFPK